MDDANGIPAFRFSKQETKSFTIRDWDRFDGDDPLGSMEVSGTETDGLQTKRLTGSRGEYYIEYTVEDTE